MKSIISLSLMAVMTVTFSHSQSLKYTIKALGMNTGTLTSSKTESNGNVTYKNESDAGVNYLFSKYEYKHSATMIFKDGVLVSGYVRSEKNGKPERFCSVKANGSGGYNIETERGKSTTTKKITFNAAMLYHIEPVGITEVFFDMYGEFVKVEAAGSHKYYVYDPDGKKHTYTYENGVLTLIESPTSVGTAKCLLQ